MNKESDKRKLVKDYCREHKDAKDYTLSKKIYNENRQVFASIEIVRNYVRSIRGHHGKKHRQEITDKSLYTEKNYDTNNAKPFKEEVNTGAKILILDIETMPAKAFVWNVWQQNIAPSQIISDWFIVTWAAKWLFEDTVYSGALTPKEVRKQNDKRIMEGMWALLNEADIIIAHNGEKFDIPRLNTRFLIHRMNPPTPFVIIDTLKHIRRKFDILHNKLDYVNQILELPRKQETGGFELWAACYDGKQEALDKMLEYNVGDVRILEETYLRIRPWITPHPNISLHILDETQSRCASCGSADLKEEGKEYHTTANVYTLLRCNNCGASNRKRLSNVTIKQRRHLLLSTPR